MRKPGTDETNVQMTDVLCDFCRREWTEDLPMMEGHHGSCVCGNCLTVAYTDLVRHGNNSAPADFKCPLCLETGADRLTQNRGDEPGWPSPLYPESVVCRRCVKQAAVVLERDDANSWSRPPE